MARILITSGPTREYLDPVRYLTNASSGRMGKALAESLLRLNHEVVIVSGPVDVTYPAGATVISITSTQEMLDVCYQEFSNCNGLIGVAAACDYRPVHVADQKIKKTGQPILVELVETADIMASLSQVVKDQWLVGFALETEDIHFRAMTKLQKKNCDLIVLNGPQAMHALDTSIQVLNQQGEITLDFSGTKEEASDQIVALIERELIQK